MSEIRLREAEIGDAGRLLEIYSYYVKNTAVTYEWEVPSLQEFEKRIATVKEKFPYLVALQEDKIVGYAYAAPFRTRAAYAWNVETSIYVDKDCRGSGVGTMLLNELERQLKAQNILNIYAVISYKEEEDEYLTHGSVLFHDKMGYKKVSEWHQCGYKFKRWYNIVIMEKMLGEHTEEPRDVVYKLVLKNKNLKPHSYIDSKNTTDIT